MLILLIALFIVFLIVMMIFTEKGKYFWNCIIIGHDVIAVPHNGRPEYRCTKCDKKFSYAKVCRINGWR
jgi:hypothetical protein